MKKIAFYSACVFFLFFMCLLSIYFQKKGVKPNDQWKPIKLSEKSTQIDSTLNKYTVYISGEVLRPGVYSLTPDQRLYDLIRLSGGFTKLADTAPLNLASRIKDGQKVTIPRKNTSSKSSSHSQKNLSHSSKKISLNTATERDLIQLPGIGKTTARNIILYRNRHGPFATLSSLTNVTGIGKKSLKKLSPYLSL